MGTTVQSITGRANQAEGAHGHGHSHGHGHAHAHAHAQAGPNAFFNHRNGSNWQSQPHSSIESPEVPFSAPATASGPNAFTPAHREPAPFIDAPGGSGGPQPQRTSAQIQNNSTTPNAPAARNAITPTPGNSNGPNGPNGPSGPSGPNAGSSQQASVEKRGPVEFNHAISYVNKIKVRDLAPTSIVVSKLSCTNSRPQNSLILLHSC
jgi:paired amphipathic helix protein Sin3a